MGKDRTVKETDKRGKIKEKAKKIGKEAIPNNYQPWVRMNGVREKFYHERHMKDGTKK